MTKWIDIKKMIPENCRTVLLYLENGCMKIGPLREGMGNVVIYRDGINKIIPITHWAELLESPIVD